MKFGEWFDPCNMEHINAYIHVRDTGNWPVGFIPNDVEIDMYWFTEAANKMANCWVDAMYRGTIKSWDC